MRLPVIEDNPDSIQARMKYFLEDAEDAQKRFDDFKKRSRDFSVRFHDDYYLVYDYTIMRFPPYPPVWFYKENLRQDQIDFLEESIRLREEERKKAERK